MPLRLVIENATWEELSRGVAAAEAVFATSAISIEDAIGGMLAVDPWMREKFPDRPKPSKEQEAALSEFKAQRLRQVPSPGWVLPGDQE
jgi:hypothetical protein